MLNVWHALAPLRVRSSSAFAQRGERLCCVLSSTSHKRQPASSPTHAHPLHRLSHQHSHQPSPHYPAMRTADGGQGWCSTCGTHSLRCVCDRAWARSAWRVPLMRAQQHQPCGALSQSRRRTLVAASSYGDRNSFAASRPFPRPVSHAVPKHAPQRVRQYHAALAHTCGCHVIGVWNASGAC